MIEIEPKLYTRYIDDILLYFPKKKTATEFNQKLNNLHQDLIFTMESCKSNKLPILDINFKLEENIFTTSIYQNPSNTDVLLNLNSFIPQSWKKT